MQKKNHPENLKCLIEAINIILDFKKMENAFQFSIYVLTIASVLVIVTTELNLNAQGNLIQVLCNSCYLEY